MKDSDRQNCPRCDGELVAAARFCSQCGHALEIGEIGDNPKSTAGSGLSSNSPERRQTTVLFCDLVGSTALSARMDPEEFVLILQTFLAAGSAVVRQHNGFIARYMGDGFLVYFGYPRAEEHSAESAVRAALELVRCVRGLRVLPDVILQVRVGIATGVVVIGDLIGSGSSREAPAWGVTPNLAARLQTIASPGTVLISDETHKLVGTLFECNALGTRQLQGFPAPVPVWEVLGARSLESRFNALRATAVGAELVGRKRELARLLSFWHRVERGHGKCVCVRAEAGIGKSKLVANFLNQIGRGVHTTLRLQCVPNLQGTAFLPLIDLLQRIAAEVAEGDVPREVALRELLAQRYGQSESEAQLIVDLVFASSQPGFALPDLASERKKEETIRVLLGFLSGTAQQGPCVVLLEDAQWADPSTLELIGRLADRLLRTPVLLTITCRSEFDVAKHLGQRVATIELSRLSEKDSRAIVQALSGGKSLPSDLMQFIISRADGVPLFLEELAKSILESSALDDLGDRYEYATSPAAAAIPATLRDSLMARLDRQPASKSIAQTAATIGREFSYGLLSAVAEVQKPHLDEALAALTHAGLIFAERAPNSDTFVFKHALVQEIARDSLLGKQRQEIHRRIAVILEQQFGDVARTRPEILAHHYTQAAQHAKAAQFWRLAGLNAVRRFANPEAASSLRRALQALALCAPSTERDALELELQAVLGQVLIHTSGYVSAALELSFLRARDLFAACANPSHQAAVLKTECLSLIVKARYAEASEAASELLRISLEAEQSSARSGAEFVAGLVQLYRGQFAAAREHLERGARLADLQAQSDESVQCLTYLGRTLWFIGYPDRARKTCIRALSIARRSPGHKIIPQASGVLALVSHQRGDLDATRRWVHSTLSRSKAQGYPYWLALAQIFDAWLAAHEGGARSGAMEVADSIAKYSATGARIGLSCVLLLEAEIEQRLGDIERAVATVRTALDHIESSGEHYYTAEVYRRQGELYLACSEPLLAESAFTRGLNIARSQGARSWELSVAISLARLWSVQGQQERAYSLLTQVYDSFTEGFTTADLRAAAQLRSQLAPRDGGRQLPGIVDQVDQNVRST